MSYAGALQSQIHGNGDPLGEKLELGDFGSDHSFSMCTPAQMSMTSLCGLAESMLALVRAQSWSMTTPPKSKAVEAYRQEIARYLEAVRLATGWKQVEMGERAGGLAHTTIGRAMKGDHTMGYPALLALEDQSGVPIPDSLVAAARGAQQPTRREAGTDADELRAIAARLMDKPKEERDAMLRELRKLLAKAS